MYLIIILKEMPKWEHIWDVVTSTPAQNNMYQTSNRFLYTIAPETQCLVSCAKKDVMLTTGCLLHTTLIF